MDAFRPTLFLIKGQCYLGVEVVAYKYEYVINIMLGRRKPAPHTIYVIIVGHDLCLDLHRVVQDYDDLCLISSS